jgi:hypothetical protein
VFDLSMDDFDDNDVLLDWEMYAGAVLQACSATGVSNHPLCRTSLPLELPGSRP